MRRQEVLETQSSRDFTRMENRFGLPGINTENPRPLNEGDKSHSFQCFTNSPLRGFPGTKFYLNQSVRLEL